MRRAVKITLIIIFCTIMFYSGYQIYDILHSREEASETYEEINKYVNVSPTIGETESTKEEIIEDNATIDNNESDDAVSVDVDRYIDVDFDALTEVNSDFFGWLYLIDDTIINYPVVQGKDNSYYLNHLFDRTVNSHGTLFLDYRNNSEEFNDNSIIYGHTMQSATMFHALGKFKNQSYYEEHPYFILELPEKEYVLEVFACYATPAVSNSYLVEFNEIINTATDNSGNQKVTYKYDNSIPTFDQWYENVMNKSLIETDVVVTAEDRIFTMSACDYSFTNARVVVHCKAVETEFSKK